MAKQAASQDGRLFGGNGFCLPAGRLVGTYKVLRTLAGCVFTHAIVGQQGSGNIVPDTEDGAGNGGRRLEIHEGQGSGQTGILHTHFDGDGPDFGFR